MKVTDTSVPCVIVTGDHQGGAGEPAPLPGASVHYNWKHAGCDYAAPAAKPRHSSDRQFRPGQRSNPCKEHDTRVVVVVVVVVVVKQRWMHVVAAALQREADPSAFDVCGTANVCVCACVCVLAWMWARRVMKRVLCNLKICVAWCVKCVCVYFFVPGLPHTQVLESAVVMWTKQIKGILKQDPETALKEGHPGPEVELEFWRAKAENLNSLHVQVKLEEYVSGGGCIRSEE